MKFTGAKAAPQGLTEPDIPMEAAARFKINRYWRRDVTHKKKRALMELWQKIDVGLASEEERIDAAILAGKGNDPDFIPRLHLLLGDEKGQVRYYALQSLVIDLKQTGEAMQEHCWRMLRSDPDEDVRSMAATCLGKILFGSRSRQMFHQLLTELKNSSQPDLAKGLIYSALFKVAGRPPLEWPGLIGRRKVFEESDIDWKKVAWLEDRMENP